MNEQVDMSLVVGILITMVFSAFFSGMEIAFVSSNRMLAEMDKEKNGLTQRLLSLFYNHPNGFVSTMLVGNNIALVVYGILIATGLKIESKRFGLDLKSVFGRNSPVKSTISVDRMVSAGTVNAASKPAKIVLSKRRAIRIP